MRKQHTTPSKPMPTLRERAVAAVSASRTDIARMSSEEIQRLVYEFQIHQIELEMQNQELSQAQGELVQSRDRFNHLYDFAPVGYVTLDHDGTVLEANLTLAAMLAVERHELIGRKFTRFVSRDAQDTLYLHQDAVLGYDMKQACDLRLRRADGKTFAARMETIGLRDAVSGACHYRSAIIDVTERKQAEASVEQAQATVQSVLNTAPIGIMFAEADGKITVTNNVLREILGSPVSGDALGPHDGYRLCHLDGSEFTPEALPLPRALQAGVTSRDVEILIKRDDGSETVALVAATPLRDGDGKIRGATAVLQDITKRKRAEAALQGSEERLRLALDGGSLGTWERDMVTGAFTQDEKAHALLGIRATTYSEGEFFNAIDSQDREKFLAVRQRAIAEHRSFTAEFRVHRADGSVAWILTSAKPYYDESGKVMQLRGICMDITERKNVEEQLRLLTADLERRVDERTVALRSSQKQLRALAGRHHALQEAERAQLARELHDQFGAAMTALKVDLHWIMARLPKSAGDLAKKAIAMSDLIDETVNSIRRTATLLRPRLLDDFGLVAAIEWQTEEFRRRTGIRCVTRLPEEDEIDLDHGRATALFRILQEALTNVTRHAKATEVAVRLQRDGAKLSLEVQDNGVGIGRKNIADRKSFGLFGMQERAYAFGGQVRFKRGRHRGTLVTVEIPLNQKAVAPWPES